MTPYDDPSFSYPKYWVGRQYEHQSEVLAIHNLLGKERFLSLADVGGGYGRLIPALSQYSPRITLIEPSTKQRKIAENYLKIVNCKLKIGVMKSQSGLLLNILSQIFTPICRLKAERL